MRTVPASCEAQYVLLGIVPVEVLGVALVVWRLRRGVRPSTRQARSASGFVWHVPFQDLAGGDGLKGKADMLIKA
jgi:hypothetical protein